MGVVFDGSSYPLFQKREDLNGKTWLYAYATTGATATYPYEVIAEEGYLRARPLSDNTDRYWVGVPDKAISSANYGWFQIGGFCDDMTLASLSVTAKSLSVSAGHAVRIKDGAPADSGSDFSGVNGDFAVCVTATTNASTIDVVLVPELITGTS